MMRKTILIMLATALLWLAGAAPWARADPGPWIPPSWMTTAIGDAVQGAAALSGGSWTVDVPSGGDIVHDGDYGCGSACVRKITGKLGTPNADGSPTFWQHIVYAGSGTDASGYAEGRPWYGNAGPVGFRCRNSDGTLGGHAGFYDNAHWPTMCSYGVGQFYHGRGADSGYGWDNWSYTVGGSAATVTTELTCRDVQTGQDHTVSETAVGSTPSPVCPAGTVLIRLKVIDSAGKTLLDTSITNVGGLTQCAANGGCLAQASVGGFPCISGNPTCDAWLGGGPAPAGAECHAQTRGPVLLSMSIDKSDCPAAWEAENVTPTSSGDDETNPVVRAVESAAKAIVNAVNQVKNAVTGVRDAIVRAVTPDPGVIAGLTNRAKNALGSPLAGWGNVLGSMAAAWSASPAGCQGPAFPIPWAPGKTYTMYPLQACDEPQKTLAGIVRLMVTVVMLSGAGWTAVRSLAAGFGYNDN